MLISSCSEGSASTIVRERQNVPPPIAQLHAIGGGTVGAAIPNEHPRVSYVFALRALCTTGRPARITSVRAYGASHMRVIAWGVRLRTPQSGYTLSGDKDAVPGVPSDNPGFRHQPVTVKCGTNPAKAVNDFAVGVKFFGKRGTMLGASIGYGDKKILRSQFAIALCSTKKCARAS